MVGKTQCTQPPDQGCFNIFFRIIRTIAEIGVGMEVLEQV